MASRGKMLVSLCTEKCDLTNVVDSDHDVKKKIQNKVSDTAETVSETALFSSVNPDNNKQSDMFTFIDNDLTPLLITPINSGDKSVSNDPLSNHILNDLEPGVYMISDNNGSLVHLNNSVEGSDVETLLNMGGDSNNMPTMTSDTGLLQTISENCILKTRNIEIMPSSDSIHVEDLEQDEFENNYSYDTPNIEEIKDEFTKAGKLRKRRLFVHTVAERKEIKRRRISNEHPVKESCSENCIYKCSSKISNNRQMEINKQFWNLTTIERKTFVMNSVSKKPVERRTCGPDSRRSFTNEYNLKTTDGTTERVCKTFFLATLGYTKNNDKIIQNLSKQISNISPSPDGRKNRTPHNKVDHEIIKKHIECYEPSISHYRREHAPNRRYLPSDMSVVKMHEDFVKKYPDFKCSYDLYRSEVKKLNISFVKLGQEECEQCENFKLHGHDQDNLQTDHCQICKNWKLHIRRAETSRTDYRSDAGKLLNDEEIIYSVDMEKVIMLPRCDMFKSVMFTKRLTVYNETFVPVGKKPKQPTVACVWHDAIRGRNKEELISTLFKFLVTECRDTKQIVLWMDNCSSQNKNWAFLTFLIFCVNSPFLSADTIHIKYFEPGHSFMSADSFHHRVEKSLQRTKKVYDFEDFKKVVQNASPNVTLCDMAPCDFYKWKDCAVKRSPKKSNKKAATRSSKKKQDNPPNDVQARDSLPYLRDITQIKATCGKKFLQYKVSFEDNSEWKDLHFLNNVTLKQGLHLPPAYVDPIGIPKERKKSIIKQLIENKKGIIPENRISFWKELPEKKEESQ